MTVILYSYNRTWHEIVDDQSGEFVILKQENEKMYTDFKH